MSTVLIIDDERNLLYSLQAALETDEVRVETASSGRQGIAAAKKHRTDAVIVDVRLPDQSGLEVFEQLRRLDPRLPVVVVTAFAAADTAIEAMKRGAFEYLLKPVDLHQLREVVGKALALRRMQSVPAVVDGQPGDSGSDLIVGRSPAMQEVYKAVGRFAPQDVTVLLLGESGTGKELVARAIYQYSRRADRPFLAINCAAIPEALLESELFGHEKGAFTGADRQRVGKFEQVDGGSLFLDEIGDMSPGTQAKVLRVLQDQTFERVGGREPVTTDVRLIAATNRRLDELAANGHFRQDLLYRLNGVTVQLPPLRERAGDLPLLVEHFVRQAGERLGKRVTVVTPEAMTALLAHPWPGNVRELQNAIRYAVIQATSDVLTPRLPAVHDHRQYRPPSNGPPPRRAAVGAGSAPGRGGRRVPPAHPRGGPGGTRRGARPRPRESGAGERAAGHVPHHPAGQAGRPVGTGCRRIVTTAPDIRVRGNSPMIRRGRPMPDANSEHHESNRRFYDRISNAYDMIADSNERAARQAGVEALHLRPGEGVLELGFGTGNEVLDLAAKVGPGGRVAGIDISSGMLAVANRKLADAAPATPIDLRVGDARTLPFGDSQFDAVYTSFTLELFPAEDLPLVLAETRRVLKPGGRVGVVSMATVRPGHTASVMERVYVWMHRHFPHLVDCRPIDPEAVLSVAGFRILSVRELEIWTMPVRVVIGGW